VLRRRVPFAAVLVALTLVLAACSDDPTDAAEPTDGSTSAAGEGGSITVYSGRDEEFVGSLFDDFTAGTGVEVDVRYGDSAELAAQILEEGDGSPADVFFAQDAGSLGAVAEAGLFASLPDEVLDRVDERFRSDDGLWVGTSGRGRVLVYNTDVLAEADLPGSILDLTDPSWKGRIGLPPTNSSFQAHVAAMIETQGADATREWLEGIMANEPVFYEDNGATTRAVGAGEIDAGLVNHYYKYEVEAEDGALPIENHYFAEGDPGAFVNTAGVGVLTTAENPDGAQVFVDYLTGEPGQTWVSEDSWEYPVVAGYEPSVDLLSLSEFQGPPVDLSTLGARLPEALDLLAQVGMI
jgi:iron(III) transport system substrate-binding protein